jgi:hypothetical protein
MLWFVCEDAEAALCPHNVHQAIVNIPAIMHIHVMLMDVVGRWMSHHR